MKSLIHTLSLILALTSPANATKGNIYQEAFIEISQMLNGEKELDFKRAVFLSENAYLNGTLRYRKFNSSIQNIITTLHKFINDQKIQHHPNAKQYAIFSYMMTKSSYNDSTSMSYDFEDLTGKKDWTKMFVTKLMKEKTGNCHSLPYLFKILAEEINAEAYLALAPNHLFIKHQDANGQWINVELTNGSFPRDVWIMESTAISTKAIQERTYPEPLTLKQSVSLVLIDLAQGYQRKFGNDEFVLKCVREALRHFPNFLNAHFIKSNLLIERFNALLTTEGTEERNQLLWELRAEILSTDEIIEKLGYSPMPGEQYESWLQEVAQKSNHQKSQQKSN